MTKKEEIVALRAQGLTYRKIKELTGASLGLIGYYCAPNQKQKSNLRVRDRRNKLLKYIQEAKANKPCLDCGELFPYFVMEFDHVRGTKIANLASMARNSSLKAIQDEIKKCDLVCANCHRFRTWNRITQHGADTLDFEVE